MELKGTYFNGKISTAYTSTLKYDGNYFYISDDKINELAKVHKSQTKIDKLLGSTNLVFEFRNGGVFESEANYPYEFENLHQSSNKPSWLISFLEANSYIAVIGVLLFAVSMYFSYTEGIPYFAEKIVHEAPLSLMETLDENTLEVIDNFEFEESELAAEEIVEVNKIFDKVVADLGNEFNYRLLIKKSDRFGANAIALPGGSIIITDELIALAENNDDLTGVIAHEIAHIEKRHGVRSVVQNAGIFLLISTVLGDYTTLTALAVGIPQMLLYNGYSRDFEREADSFAAHYLLETRGTTISFERMLSRLSQDEEITQSSNFISTHPAITERIILIKNLAVN